MAQGRGSNKLNRNTRTEAKKRKINEQPARTRENKMRKLKYRVRMNPADRQAFDALRKALQ